MIPSVEKHEKLDATDCNGNAFKNYTQAQRRCPIFALVESIRGD